MKIGFMKDLRLSEVRDIFLLDCQAADLKSTSICRYRKVLTDFIQFTGDITVQELKPDHVRMYLAELFAQKLSKEIVAKRYRIVRMWIRWLYAQKLLTERRGPTAPRLRYLFQTRGLMYY